MCWGLQISQQPVIIRYATTYTQASSCQVCKSNSTQETSPARDVIINKSPTRPSGKHAEAQPEKKKKNAKRQTRLFWRRRACQRPARCETLQDALAVTLTQAGRHCVDPLVMTMTRALSSRWYRYEPGMFQLGVSRICPGGNVYVRQMFRFS